MNFLTSKATYIFSTKILFRVQVVHAKYNEEESSYVSQ
jgi:hypothetical protein